MSPSVSSPPPPPSTSSVPSHPPPPSSAASPSSSSSLPTATPPQPSVGTFSTPATTTFQPHSSPNAGGGAPAAGGSLANLFNHPGPVSSSSSSSSAPTNASSSNPSSTVEVSPLTSSEGFERAPFFPGNLAGASGAPRSSLSSSIPILPVGPGGFGRHREMVYSRPISRPSSAQSWNEEKVSEGGAREGAEWQATVRGPPAPPAAQGGLSVPRSSSVAGGLVVHAPGTPTAKVRHRPHSFHAGMQDSPRYESGNRDATIRGAPGGGGGGASSNYPISEYLADPTLFDGALQTATPGLPTGGSEGTDGTGGGHQQAYYHQMQHQQQQRGHPSSSDRPRHGQSPPPQQGSFYPHAPPQHRSASYSHPHHPPPPASYYSDPRGLRHSQPNIHPSSSSSSYHHPEPSHYLHAPLPRSDARDPRDPRVAYAQQQQQHHQLATPQHQSYQSSYGQQMPPRSGPPPVHQRPSLPFPINSPSTPPAQHRSHSMNSAHPSSTPSSLDPSSLQPGSSYRTHPDGSDWSTSSAGEGDSAGEYSYSSTSASGADGEDGEMKELDELDEEVDIMRVYSGPGPSSYVGGAIGGGGGPDGLMRMQRGEYSDEEDDHAIDPRDPQYANATRYRGSGPSRLKRESVSSSHYVHPPPSSRQYYSSPQSSYPYGGSSLPTYLNNSSPPPQPMYPISAYGLVAPQGSYQGYPPPPMHHQGPNGTPQRKPRLVKTSKIPAPIPVPHLNKRSRGRHVPIDPTVVRSKKGGNGRVYECMVTECGKCFGRSEHLKRHIRSLHTNEKPFPCPHPTCTKEFSRHDNLNQHFRIHLASPTDQAAMEGLDMAGLGIVGTRLGGPEFMDHPGEELHLMERQRSI